MPILTLTATAVPRVREDVISSLLLRSPLVEIQSFDRSNLRLQVHRKPPNSGGFVKTLAPLVQELKGGRNRSGGESTIIYAPTISKVQEISQWLSMQFIDMPQICVKPYHSRLSDDEREEAHVGFLVGRVTVIVATVAFGMGIDKLDTRRVIHLGPPKTMEEYVQQIGRAGRDGLTAICTMYANDSDFLRYRDDFYLGKLTKESKTAVEQSMERLRSYAMDTEQCRRAALLHFFEEIPPFGERCGTCDNCVQFAKHKDDSERDFAKEARVVLLAVAALNSQGASIIENIMNGHIVEGWRYRYGADPTIFQERIKKARNELIRKYPVSFFKELIPMLVKHGYLNQGSKTGGERKTVSRIF